MRPVIKASVLEAQQRKREVWQEANRANVAYARKQKAQREAEAVTWIEEVKARKRVAAE